MTREDLQPYFDTYPNESKMFVVGEGHERQVFTGSNKTSADNYAICGRNLEVFYRVEAQKEAANEPLPTPVKIDEVTTDYRNIEAETEKTAAEIIEEFAAHLEDKGVVIDEHTLETHTKKPKKAK